MANFSEKERASRRRYKKKYYQRTSFSKNRGNKYTCEEEQMILKHEVTDTELSKILGRSVTSIQHKRYRLLGKEIR